MKRWRFVACLHFSASFPPFRLERRLIPSLWLGVRWGLAQWERLTLAAKNEPKLWSWHICGPSSSRCRRRRPCRRQWFVSNHCRSAVFTVCLVGLTHQKCCCQSKLAHYCKGSSSRSLVHTGCWHNSIGRTQGTDTEAPTTHTHTSQSVLEAATAMAATR